MNTANKVFIEWIYERKEYRVSINRDTIIIYAKEYKINNDQEVISFYSSIDMISIVHAEKENIKIETYGNI